MWRTSIIGNCMGHGGHSLLFLRHASCTVTLRFHFISHPLRKRGNVRGAARRFKTNDGAFALMSVGGSLIMLLFGTGAETRIRFA